MISVEEIKKLADLTRIKIVEEEAGKLALEIDAILEYVGQVSHFAEASRDKSELGEVDVGDNYNVLREDGNPTESGIYTKEIVAEFPDSENGYLKVKKIL